MEQITLTEAGRRKKCRHSCISKALRDGFLDGVQVGQKFVAVNVNRRFEVWEKGPPGQSTALRRGAFRQRLRQQGKP